MSQLIRITNEIKIKRNRDWLTDSQQYVLTALKNRIRYSNFINLFGDAGVGKTFLTWFFSEEMNYYYIPLAEMVDEVPDGAYGVVIDNLTPVKSIHRNLLHLLSYKNINRGLFITRKIIEDYTVYIELKLSERDIQKVTSTLSSNNIPRDYRSQKNLWEVICND